MLFDGLFKRKETAPLQKPTYFVTGTGITHDCAFPSPRFKGRSRQFVLDKCKAWEPIYLKPYTWEGRPAYAIMSQKYDTDIGVIPADKVKTIQNKSKGADKIAGIITDIRIVNPDEEDYLQQKKIFDIGLYL